MQDGSETLSDRFALGRRAVLAGALGLGAVSAIAPLAALETAPPRKLAAFCLGIDRYANLRPLSRAVADAETVAARLGAIGYRTTLARDAGLAAMMDGFGAFCESLDADTAAFVFLAGHGLQVAGQNYLLPADIGVLESEDSLAGAVVFDSWLRDLTGMEPAQAIVVLDACRNGGLATSIPRQAHGLAPTDAPGVFVAFSATAGEFALDTTGEDDCAANGLFTRHFIEELKPQALIYDAIANTKAKVIPAARDVGHSQHPVVFDQSSRPYRIDGAPASASAQRLEAACDLEGTGVVIAAAQRYGCGLNSLMTPIADAERLQRQLESYGAEVVMAIEPTRDSLLAACRDLGARGFAQLGFYWAGMGGLVNGQACALVAPPDCGLTPDSLRGVASSDGNQISQFEQWRRIEVVSHSDLVAAFRTRPVNEEGGKAARAISRARPDATPLLLLFDACLNDYGQYYGEAEFARDVRLEEMNYQDQVAVLAASSFFQSALDAAPGKTSSPFTIALLNAIGMPGLSLAQMAAQLREEVEALTKRAQTPQLFAGEAIQEMVFVRERARPQAAGCAAA